MRFPVAAFRAAPTALFACVLALLPVHSASAADMPQGGLRRDMLSDYAPDPSPGRTHNEFWTWQFRLNDGLQIQMNMSRVHLGSLKDPVCGSDLAVMGFKGRNYFVAREYPLRNFTWDPGAGRLEVHNNIWAEGIPPREHRVHFSTSKGGVDYFLDLTFEHMTPGAVWGDGMFRLAGGEKASLFFHIPSARVRGRLAINGDTIAVRGFGAMDHSRQTQFATRFMDAGYRYVVTSGRVEAGYFLQKGSRVSGYGIREENGVLKLLKPEALRIDERTSWGGISVPRRLDVLLDGRPPVNLQRVEDRQRTSVLQELGSLERMGARMYLGGEIFGYRGMGRVDDSLPAIYSFTMVKR